MNLIKLQGINFTTHTNTIVTFKNDGFYVVIGKTGSGKTSILDIVSYTLFGKTPRGEADELVRKGTNQMKTGVLFESNGKYYQVIRKRVLRKSTSLQLSEVNGKDLTGKTIKETQERLEKIIGLDYDLYKMSVCFEQGKSDTFNILTPTSAKTSLMKLLQLDIYKGISQKIREILSDYTTKREVYTSEEKTYNTQLEELKLKPSVTDVKVRSKETIEKDDKTIEKLEGILQDLQKQRDDKYKDYADVSGSIKAQSEILKKLKKEIKKIKELGDRCPLCEQKLTEENKLTTITNKLKEFESIKKEVDKSVIESEKLMRHLNKIDDNISNGSKKHDELLFEEEKTNKVETQRKIDLEAVKKVKENLTTLQNKLKELKTSIEKIDMSIETYSYLKEAFGKNGIQVYIINKVIPEIEYVANDLINDITDGRLNIELRTQVEGKGGELLDTFRIIITDDLVEREYSTYSGGERFIIDFSIRLALSILLSHRTGFKIDTVIIDEGFSGLDEDNQRMVLSAINKTITKYKLKKVILITHIENLSESIENKISVTKENGVSKIT